MNESLWSRDRECVIDRRLGFLGRNLNAEFGAAGFVRSVGRSLARKRLQPAGRGNNARPAAGGV